jgi:hypothetical protein
VAAALATYDKVVRCPPPPPQRPICKFQLPDGRLLYFPRRELRCPPCASTCLAEQRDARRQHDAACRLDPGPNRLDEAPAPGSKRGYATLLNTVPCRFVVAADNLTSPEQGASRTHAPITSWCAAWGAASRSPACDAARACCVSARAPALLTARGAGTAPPRRGEERRGEERSTRDVRLAICLWLQALPMP